MHRKFKILFYPDYCMELQTFRANEEIKENPFFIQKFVCSIKVDTTIANRSNIKLRHNIARLNLSIAARNKGWWAVLWSRQARARHNLLYLST